MNQKQRDILCKMVKERSDVLERELGKQFPQKRGYNIENLRDYAGDFFATLGKSLTKAFDSLNSKQKELDEKEKNLKSKWNEYEKMVEAHEEQIMESKRIAVGKLSAAVGNAVVEIQFAEDVQGAKEILNSLPTLADLTS